LILSAAIEQAGTIQVFLSLLHFATIFATYYASLDLAPSSAVAAVTQSPPLSWYADAGVAAHRSLAAGAAFSVRWRGLVRPPTAGQWTIGCEVRGGSDDGVRLLWEGAVVADGFSGNVNGSNVSGVVGVGVANGYYEVGIEYYSLSGASGLNISFKMLNFSHTTLRILLDEQFVLGESLMETNILGCFECGLQLSLI